jgi:hypothetical protein
LSNFQRRQNISKEQTSTISFGLLFPRILASFLIALTLLIPITNPNLVQSSDFLFTFYLAGQLLAAGRPLDIYADPAAANLLNSAFNAYAHKVFGNLPASLTACYMYPPLTALVFVPFGYLAATMSLLAWQGLSILALCLCTYLLAGRTSKGWPNLLAGAILFFPIMQTLVIGQLGIVLGLLPLSIGYWLLLRGRQLLAGCVLSFLFLKPQFFPVALLVSLALALAGRIRCLAAFTIGTILLVLLNLQLFGAPVFESWLCTLKMANLIYTNPQYTAPNHLLSCLCPAVLQLLPFDMRLTAKMIFYPISAIIALHALLTCRRIIKAAGNRYVEAIPFVFVLSILVLPLVMPYLLYYDLSILVIAGVLVSGQDFFRSNRPAMRDFILGWLFIDVYLIAVLALGKQLVQPILLVAGLGLLYSRALKVSQSWAKNLTLEKPT